MRIIGYIATNKEGYVSDADGNVKFLDHFPKIDMKEFAYEKFIAKIDGLIMGSNTYKWLINEMNKVGFDWPYKDKKSFVLSNSLDKVEHATLVKGEIKTINELIEKQGIENLWVMGGAKLCDSYAKLKLYDEFIISTFDYKMKDGIKLTCPEMTEVKEIELEEGVIIKVMKSNK